MSLKLLFSLTFQLFILLAFASCATTEGIVVDSNRGTITVSSLTVEQPGLVPGTFEMGVGQLRIEYPDTCYNAGIEGVVEIFIDIQNTGEVAQARVTRGIGGGCDEAALKAIRNSEFNPARDSEGTVTARHNVQVTFSRDE